MPEFTEEQLDVLRREFDQARGLSWARVLDHAVLALLLALALTLTLVIAASIIGRQEERTAGAVICGLFAPVEEVTLPNGETVQQRPEAFGNHYCLSELGFDPVDLNGDGRIEH